MDKLVTDTPFPKSGNILSDIFKSKMLFNITQQSTHLYKQNICMG